RTVHAAWEAIDPSFEESARALGAGRLQTFLTVTLPMIAPGVVTGSLLAFVFSFMSFPIVLALGGARLATMEVEIYTQVRVLLDYGTGAALALVETLLSLLLTFIYLRVEARLRTRWVPLRRQPTVPLRFRLRHTPPLLLAGVAGAFFLAPPAPAVWAALPRAAPLLSLLLTFIYLRVEARLRTRWVPLRRQPTVPLRFRLRHTPLLLLAVVAGAFFLAPLAAVVWDALTRGAEHGLTLQWFAMLFNPGHHAITGDSPLQAILNSLRFGVGTVLLAVPLGVLASLAIGRLRWPGRDLLELLVLTPLGVSGVALGFGLLRATVRSPLAGGAQWAVVAVHALLALPFVVRTVRPALEALHPSLRESARALGASRWRALRDVELPLIVRSLLLGGALAFSISFSEMTATITLAP